MAEGPYHCSTAYEITYCYDFTEQKNRKQRRKEKALLRKEN